MLDQAVEFEVGEVSPEWQTKYQYSVAERWLWPLFVIGLAGNEPAHALVIIIQGQKWLKIFHYYSIYYRAKQ